ncbi:MAG: cytochrome C oxidase subunit IV family protein [Zoogloea sp.]|nr:cytochrome C oxidase subunit IV family protein [Zoogloea sp.]
MNTRRSDIAWLVLLAATAVTWTVGETGAAGFVAMATILVMSLIKARLVALDFMGLRAVRPFWRALLLGWLGVVLGLIAFAYYLGLPG